MAADALIVWQKGERFVADGLRHLGQERKLAANDHALAQQIAMGVLRHISLLEFNLKRYVKKLPVVEVRMVLLQAMYQIYWLDRIPNSAAVDTAVELIKKRHPKKTVGFVNAVLRKVVSEPMKVPHQKKLSNLAVRYSHPGWLVHKWHQEMGFKKMTLRLKANNMEPVSWLRLRGDESERKKLLEALHEITPIDPESVRFEQFVPVESLGPVLKSDLFASGKLSVQDPAGFLMVSLLDAPQGSSVLDMCAAPGGKSSLILDEFSDVDLVSCDLQFERLESLDELLGKRGQSLQRIQMDGLQPPFKTGAFSHILIDAPCSNLGVVRRRPEAIWKTSLKDIQAGAQLQLDLLQKGADLLESGGVLVYGTCSPEPEETSALVELFLDKNPDFELQNARKFIPSRYVKNQCLHIYPAPGSLDGYFGARFIKK